MQRPTIFEAAGGARAFARLTERFYDKVKSDAVLAPVFAGFTADHAANVAIWLGEVFGGPPRYSQELGGHRTILERHQGLQLSELQCARWAALMIETAREVLPADDALRRDLLRTSNGARALPWPRRCRDSRSSTSGRFRAGTGWTLVICN